MKYISLTILVFILNHFAISAQSDLELITNTLKDYIEGTANGEPQRLEQAFHEDFNLYFVKGDSLNVWSGQNYIGNIIEGRKSNRIGRIISIDIENNAAMAKVEILMPEKKRIYTDYFLLLKLKENWKIIHKSFTYIPFNGAPDGK